jgi:anti-anti-sigma factor
MPLSFQPASALSEQRRFVLCRPVVAASLSQLRADVARAVSDGTRDIFIDIDQVTVLDSLTIATLIKILGEARKGGAALTLWATRKSLLDTLRITALVKVFTIVSEDAVPPAPAPPSRRTGNAKAHGREPNSNGNTLSFSTGESSNTSGGRSKQARKSPSRQS